MRMILIFKSIAGRRPARRRLAVEGGRHLLRWSMRRAMWWPAICAGAPCRMDFRFSYEYACER